MAQIETTRSRAGNVEVAERRAGSAAVLYVHGVPNTAEMWDPFLERIGGTALDLPGFGESDKPAQFEYSFAGYRDFLLEYTARIDRFSLVMHDWGAAALGLAMARPEAIEKIVVLNGVPLLPGYRWHGIARAWRTRVVGELFMGFSSQRVFRFLARREGTVPRALVDAEVERVWKHFDHGTQRAILKLYRAAPEGELARAGEGLDRIGSPALVVWGERDPYLPARFAHDYARALGGSARVVPGAGHWPWFEEPDVIEHVATFLAT